MTVDEAASQEEEEEQPESAAVELEKMAKNNQAKVNVNE